ncbi:Zinc-finger of the MIZ type domain containing protein [Euroglyphus maynei]|uniref:E3 SUMO-protein ligase NSE2 n=1 Tax=Euroglyphus maynei TaxID=6958 RepID=A0A1Y3BTP6_EURMA|nr:Zinc-finger of the MIZ type domain containing protein [Euroglyphus maynei]
MSYRNIDHGFTPLNQKIDQTIECVLQVAEQLFEDKIKHETEFNDDVKQELKEIMEKIIDCKHQLSLQNVVLNSCIDQLEADEENSDQQANSIEVLDKYHDFDKIFDEKFQQSIQSNTIDYNNHDGYRKLLRWFEDDDRNKSQQSNVDNGDIEMMESEEFSIPIDPICRTEINIPIRNKQCGHLYDKESLFNLFRNNSTIKCPVTGCSNKKMTATDVEEDSRLRILIENARQNQ